MPTYNSRGFPLYSTSESFPGWAAAFNSQSNLLATALDASETAQQDDDAVATVDDLPETGNWAGRTCFVIETGGIWLHNGTNWRLMSQPWTDFTPTLYSGTMTLGTGGSVLYAKYKVYDGEIAVRVGWKFGSSGFAFDDPIWEYPIAAASWVSVSNSPIGVWHWNDSSAGASGRYANDVWAGTGMRLTISQIAGIYVQIGGTTVPNTTLQANDEILLHVQYPI